MTRLFPSLISADLLHLQQTIETLEPHCDGFHLDVMDNHFVPNLTFGPAIINAIGTVAKKTLWVHLMVTNPSSIIKQLTIPHGALITFHYETTENKATLIDLIRSRGWEPSIAISPKTPISALFPLIQEYDLHHVLIMLVEPGFSGQTMIASATHKIEQLNIYKEEHKLNNLRIGIDGGVTKENIALLQSMGAQDIVAANAIFKGQNPVENLQLLRQALK
jgi:ribulose-phosphate 3-epimerase